MTFGLPKSCLGISTVTIASTDVDLIEGHIDRSASDRHLGLPQRLDHGMEILPDSIRTGIPEPNPLNKFITERIVGERVGEIIA